MSGSTVGVRCAGCNIEEVHPWNGPGPEDDARMAEMQSRGWMRRTFGPGASPWFCSRECAYDSHTARTAEAWWVKKDEEERQKEFERYCKETPNFNPGMIAVMGFALILVLSALLGNCLHA